MNKNYEDIIYLARPVSKVHRPMTQLQRAAQFSPFAALTGYDDLLKETARITETKPFLSEDQNEQISRVLNQIKAQLHTHPKIEVTYFKPDKRKAGGAAQTLCERVKNIIETEHRLILMNQASIPFESILSLHLKENSTPR